MASGPRILLFSTLFPSSVRPGHGIFVAARLHQLLATEAVEVKVVAPVPWFPFRHDRFGEYARMARTPAHETKDGVEAWYPRYLLPPKVGMTIAPLALALGAAPTLRRLIRHGFDFDTIDAHYYYPDGVAAALLARYFRKSLVITARGSDINLIADYKLPRRMMQWAARNADASIAVSRALASAMQARGIASCSLEVLRNGVDLNRFQCLPQGEARLRLQWPEMPTLISVGNLIESKGQRLAIEALPALTGFRLCVVGSGPDESLLKSLARQLGVAERVLFCGRIAQEQMSSYYSAADILVLPSSREGAPNVVLEAMACGTPTVATSVGGIPEFVDDAVAGRLMANRSVGQLVSAVQNLWAQGIDRQAVRRRASRFDWTDTTRGQLEIFSRLARLSLPTGTATPATADKVTLL
jgi:teichuronic acid biosynthesis glycosyltransferase TuaC